MKDYDDRRFQDSYVHQEGTCLDVLSRELPSHSGQPSDGLDSLLHPAMGGAADDGILQDEQIVFAQAGEGYRGVSGGTGIGFKVDSLKLIV